MLHKDIIAISTDQNIVWAQSKIFIEKPGDTRSKQYVSNG
jgi:hypothetical protein